MESPSCFWEKSSLMWGACLLQVSFVPSLLSILFIPCFYLQNTMVWQRHLLSPDLCPGSVPSNWLCWKTTHFPSPFSFWQQEEPSFDGQVDRPAEQSSGSNESSERTHSWLPRDALFCLQEPWQPHSVRALRELCKHGDEVCEGGWSAGLGGHMLCWGCGVGNTAAVILQVTNPSLGHGRHSQSLMGLDKICHPPIVGCSQPWMGM